MQVREVLTKAVTGEKTTGAVKLQNWVNAELVIPKIPSSLFPKDEEGNVEVLETEKGMFVPTGYPAKKGDTHTAAVPVTSLNEDSGEEETKEVHVLCIEHDVYLWLKNNGYIKEVSDATGGKRVTGDNLIEAGVPAEKAEQFIKLLAEVQEFVKATGGKLQQYIRSKESIEKAKEAAKQNKASTGKKFDSAAVKK